MNFNSNLNVTNSKNSIGSNDVSILHKIKVEFKATLYSSMYVVLKEEPFPSFYVFVIYTIYFFQLLYLPFNPEVNDIYYIYIHMYYN